MTEEEKRLRAGEAKDTRAAEGVGPYGEGTGGAQTVTPTPMGAGAGLAPTAAASAGTGGYETEPFSYSLDGDALYQQYKDRYLANAKRSMQDTMGQAASLTGGYGSTYAQGAGQQAYDETLRGLTDRALELEQNAYGKWRDQQSLREQEYNNLYQTILQTGYQPTPQEMQRTGLDGNQAAALRRAWITANPGAAWMQGAIDANEFYMLTGQYAPGSEGLGGDGGEWYGYSGGGSGGGSGGTGTGTGTETGTGKKTITQALQELGQWQKQGATQQEMLRGLYEMARAGEIQGLDALKLTGKKG